MTPQEKSGWLIFIAALGMALGLISIDLAATSSWADTHTTVFVAKCIGNIATVIGAFVGGKLIPTKNNNG